MLGWIKLHRSLLDWEWWDDQNATRLLIYLLCAVNYEDKKWKGELIKAGSIATSWDSLSNGTHLTVKQCRIAMSKLESSREVVRKGAGRFQLVTLVKWDKLQQDTNLRAGKGQQIGQAKGRQRATTKEGKEDKEERSVYKSQGHLSISHDEFNKLVNEYGSAKANEYVDKVLNYSLNHRYKSLYLTANNWLKKDLNNNKASSTDSYAANVMKQIENDRAKEK